MHLLVIRYKYSYFNVLKDHNLRLFYDMNQFLI